MTPRVHGVLGANQHAVRVPVENVSVVIPAMNIALDQDDEIYGAYFEFMVSRTCTVHKAGAQVVLHYTCSFSLQTGNWNIEVNKHNGERWVKTGFYVASPEEFAEWVWYESEQPMQWFVKRPYVRYYEPKSCPDQMHVRQPY